LGRIPSGGLILQLNTKQDFFRVVAPCTAVVGYQSFRGPCCLHLNRREKPYVLHQDIRILLGNLRGNPCNRISVHCGESEFVLKILTGIRGFV